MTPTHGDDAIYTAHVNEFGRINGNVSRLEGRVSTVESRQAIVWKDLYGNGQPGLRDVVLQSIAASEAREQMVKTTLDLHNSKITGRYNFLTIIIAALALLVAWLTYIDTKKKVSDGTLRIPGITQFEPLNAEADKSTDLAY